MEGVAAEFMYADSFVVEKSNRTSFAPDNTWNFSLELMYGTLDFKCTAGLNR